MPSTIPFIHQTPSEAIAEAVEKRIVLGDRSFQVRYPGNPDALLDHPETHAAFQADEYMPYWADLWPSARMLSQAMLDLPEGWIGCRAMEVGCGVGLPGVVALSLGARVIFSDYDRAALTFAQQNALANGFDSDQFELLPLDWRSPPASLRVDRLLASDVIYERRNIPPLLVLIQSVLQPAGECWLVDPNRPFQSEFEVALEAAGFQFEKVVLSTQLEVDAQSSQAATQSVSGTLFRIHQASC